MNQIKPYSHKGVGRLKIVDKKGGEKYGNLKYDENIIQIKLNLFVYNCGYLIFFFL